jgi:hypothetical protein
VRITLDSTDEIERPPQEARVWRGRTEEGVPIVAWIVLASVRSGDPREDARTKRALEKRILSSAVITIPLCGRRRP